MQNFHGVILVPNLFALQFNTSNRCSLTGRRLFNSVPAWKVWNVLLVRSSPNVQSTKKGHEMCAITVTSNPDLSCLLYVPGLWRLTFSNSLHWRGVGEKGLGSRWLHALGGLLGVEAVAMQTSSRSQHWIQAWSNTPIALNCLFHFSKFAIIVYVQMLAVSQATEGQSLWGRRYAQVCANTCTHTHCHHGGQQKQADCSMCGSKMNSDRETWEAN